MVDQNLDEKSLSKVTVFCNIVNLQCLQGMRKNVRLTCSVSHTTQGVYN